MKIKTGEATGLQLDWGLAKAETQSGTYHECGWDEANAVWVVHFNEDPLRFSHDISSVWADLIEEHKISLVHRANQWRAEWDWSAAWGATPAQAVARCVIAMRLGDEFECPSELGVMS